MSPLDKSELRKRKTVPVQPCLTVITGKKFLRHLSQNLQVRPIAEVVTPNYYERSDEHSVSLCLCMFSLLQCLLTECTSTRLALSSFPDWLPTIEVLICSLARSVMIKECAGFSIAPDLITWP